MDEKREPPGNTGLLQPAAPAGGVQRRPTVVARDQVIERLQNAFAHESLDVDEFERRVSIAHQSESQMEIDDLVSDLPASTAAATPASTRVLVPSRDVKPRGRVFTAMGGVQRQGTWLVPRRLDVVTIMGGARLDFREARLPEGEVEVRVGTFMGGVEIIVPPTLAVEASGSAIMGGFEHVDRAPAHAEAGTTVLRITGLAVMGGVNIEMRLPGETERDARRRRKLALKAERKAARKALKG
ncbi:MAG TPA: LiaF domain-containing protein [Polyangia bacterium]